MAAAQWLAVRLQLLAAVLVAAVALLAVLGRAGLLPWTPAHSDRCAQAAPAGAHDRAWVVRFFGMAVPASDAQLPHSATMRG